MAAIVGGTGSAPSLPTGYNPIVTAGGGFELTLNIPTADQTPITDNMQVNTAIGPVSMSFSLTGLAQGGSSTPFPTDLGTGDLTKAAGNFTFTFETGNTIAFAGVVQSVPISRGREAPQRMTGVSSGNITLTWA